MRHASKSAQLLPWLCDAGLTLAFAWVLSRNLALGPALAPLVAGLAALLGTALFLLPRALAPAAGLPRWRAPTWLALTALAAATVALPAPAHWDWHTLPALLLIAPMTLALAAVADSMRLFVAGGAAATGWALFLLTLICAAPLWVLPVDRPEAPGPLALNALVAINPLTHLAVMTDTDFLRQDFFYRHCALGSLRYAYPTPGAVVTGYLAVCFAWLGLRWAPRSLDGSKCLLVLRRAERQGPRAKGQRPELRDQAARRPWALGPLEDRRRSSNTAPCSRRSEALPR